ncbi:CASTOR/POLLUX-related putative ion channel [Bailinhaonella thermotolerans]|nr:potassium transporter TrkA [Bailinhaonella thermotolerans]
MDRGTPALIGWLGLLSAGMIILVAGLTWLFARDDAYAGMAEQDHSWWRLLWINLMRAMDPGAVAGDSGGVVFLGLMLLISLGGIFIMSSLIGVLTTGLENRIFELRKGRSRLVEHGHTVLLGWSDQVFTMAAELVKANQSAGRSCVVILADRDKVQMEDEIRGRLGDTGRTRVICRSGSPLNRSDLDLVSLDTAKSVIVVSPQGDTPDIDVIKALLLLNNREWPHGRPHVVAAVQDSENLAAARLAGGPDALIVDADDIAVRLVVQSHRQSGLSTVCTDLLDFAGNEIYMRPEPALVGSTYGEALAAFELGSLIGLLGPGGKVRLNPPMDTRVEEGDELILIAEDDLLIRRAETPVPPVREAMVAGRDVPDAPDRTLLLGWNSRAPRIIDLLDRLVEPGSVVDVATPHPPEGGLGDGLATLRIGYKRCDPTSRRALETLDLGSYNNVVVMADDTLDPRRADDRTLVTLLHLRDLGERLGNPYAIVSEMNDETNRDVAQVTRADDFIVSSKLISLLLTQLAENRHLNAVFTRLFDPAGSEIHLKPARHYVLPGAEANFATVIASASGRGETAIGYRVRRRSDEAPHYGVVLNPRKDEPLVFAEDDSVIVLAEN